MRIITRQIFCSAFISDCGLIPMDYTGCIDMEELDWILRSTMKHKTLSLLAKKISYSLRIFLPRKLTLFVQSQQSPRFITQQENLDHKKQEVLHSFLSFHINDRYDEWNPLTSSSLSTPWSSFTLINIKCHPVRLKLPTRLFL